MNELENILGSKELTDDSDWNKIHRIIVGAVRQIKHNNLSLQARKDVAQNALGNLYLRKSGFDYHALSGNSSQGVLGNFEHYISVLVQNEVRAYFRLGGKAQASLIYSTSLVEEAVDITTLDNGIPSIADLREVVIQTSYITDIEREAVILTDFDGLSALDITTQLDIGYSTYASRLSRGRKGVRKAFNREFNKSFTYKFKRHGVGGGLKVSVD